MRRVLLAFALLFMLAGHSFAANLTQCGRPDSGTVVTLLTSSTVNATANVSSCAVNLSQTVWIGLWWNITSGGTVAVNLRWQVSPTLEESDFVDAADAIAVSSTGKSGSDIQSFPMLYGRVLVDGQDGNAASTVVTSLKLFTQGTGQ